MEKNTNNKGGSIPENDDALSLDELDSVSGGAVNLGGIGTSSGNIVKGGTTTNPSGSSNPTSTPTPGSGGFSSGSIKRP